MVTPVDVNYFAASGEDVYGGRSISLIEQAINGMDQNSWLEYTSTNINEMEETGPDGPAGIFETEANKPLSNWANTFSYDTASKQIIGVGTAEGYISDTPLGQHAKQINFDMESNQFSVKWNPTGQNSGHIYDANPTRPLNGVIYRKDFERFPIYGYTIATDTWVLAFDMSGMSPSSVGVVGIEVHPNLGPQGSLLAIDQTGRLTRFDVDSGVRSVIGTFPGVTFYAIQVYIEALDVILFGGGFGGTTMYTLDNTGAVTEFITTLPQIPHCNSSPNKLLPDPLGRAIAWMFSDEDDHYYMLDVNTGIWTDYGLIPAALQTHLALSVGVSLLSEGAIAMFWGRGRSAGVTQSKFFLFKVD